MARRLTGLITALLLALLLPHTADAQEPALTLETLEPHIMMIALFDGEEYTPERGVRWEPDLEERTTFVLSDDDRLYTMLDTIHFLSSGVGEYAEDYAVAVFSTHSWFGGERSSCHACAPETGAALFRRAGMAEEGGWELVGLRKYLGRFGAWGDPGWSELVEVGPGRSILSISSGFTGQGVTETLTVWFDPIGWIDPFERIFTYYEIVGPAGCEEECDEEWCDLYTNINRSIERRPNIDPDAIHPGFDDLLVTTVETTCTGTQTRTTTRYTYDRFGYRLVP